MYKLVAGTVRFLLRMFFREIKVEGLENLPEKSGGLLVAWHPNGLIDPGLIFAFSGKKVIFGARHGLFKWPILGWIIKSVGTVPIYRAADRTAMSEDERRSSNNKSLDALATELAGGAFSALFPEGMSHDHPFLAEVKTGAARLYCRAVQLNDDDHLPVIIPVGLHYDRKQTFRSRVLMRIHPPIDIDSDLCAPDPDGTIKKQKYQELTDQIEKTLVEVVRSTADWDLHYLMHRARKLVRAERAHRAKQDPGKPSIAERDLGFARVWYGYQQRAKTHRADVIALRDDVFEYDQKLLAMGLEDHELNRSPRLTSPLLFILLLVQALSVYVLLPPILLLGALINGPAFLIVHYLSTRIAKLDKDKATVKILAGSILYPLTWIVTGYFAARFNGYLSEIFSWIPYRPVLVGLAAFLLAAITGYYALRYSEVARQTLRAIKVRLTRSRRKRSVAELRSAREELFDRIMTLAGDIDFPGSVRDDGTVSWDPGMPD